MCYYVSVKTDAKQLMQNLDVPFERADEFPEYNFVTVAISEGRATLPLIDYVIKQFNSKLGAGIKELEFPSNNNQASLF